MHSSIIGKIEKARRYVGEPERITFNNFSLNFLGEHDNYILSYQDQQWHCSCNFFSSWRFCSHTITVQKILSTMLPKEALHGVGQYCLETPVMYAQMELEIDKPSGASPQTT